MRRFWKPLPPIPAYFNPRIPYGMRHVKAHPMRWLLLFQSTHPVWDATSQGWSADPRQAFQSTHPVWDATTIRHRCGQCRAISIHASRMGCDANHMWNGNRQYAFQSTHPVWDATILETFTAHTSIFQSTHPVWDATLRFSFISTVFCNFNPRIPYGMRRDDDPSSELPSVFQSTHPVWDATSWWGTQRQQAKISIHASRMGCDSAVGIVSSVAMNFNPRIPYGMRPCPSPPA